MRVQLNWAGAAILVGTSVALCACGGGTHLEGVNPADAGNPPPVADAGSGNGSGGPGADAGSGADAGADAGSGSDAGSADAGSADAGSGADAGTDGGTATVTFPSADGWTFYGPQNGGPQDVYDVSMDEGGNVWVAGGTEGLFLLKAGATKLQKFGLADGLHPYGYLSGSIAKARGVPDGTPADPSPSLTATPVISVAGGPAGTVFVGYQGKPGCEDEWDSNQSNHALTNPAIYKSGDADKVTLSGAGISVVHYDIYSGEGVVPNEPAGREKLCSIYRVLYDHDTHLLWFGGNHGFAMGNGDFPGNPVCNGQLSCAGVWEHVHPAINGCAPGTTSANCSIVFLTDGYYGLAKDPVSHDLWIGGQIRTTKFHVTTWGGQGGWSAAQNGYFHAESDTEDHANALAPGKCTPTNNGVPCGMENRFDIWPDKVGEWDTKLNQPTYPTVADRNDDSVSGIAALPDGTAWVSSFAFGLAHLDAYGNVIGTVTAPTLINNNLAGLALDPYDGSLWTGGYYGYGVTRYHPAKSGAPASAEQFGVATFGSQLINSPVGNVQAWGTISSRRILVAFRRNGSTAGAVAIYSK